MGIQLCGGNITMTHQLLQRAQISTVFQQVNSKAVAQCMRCDFLINMCSGLIMLKYLPEALTAHANATNIHKWAASLVVFRL